MYAKHTCCSLVCEWGHGKGRALWYLWGHASQEKDCEKFEVDSADRENEGDRGKEY